MASDGRPTRREYRTGFHQHPGTLEDLRSGVQLATKARVRRERRPHLAWPRSESLNGEMRHQKVIWKRRLDENAPFTPTAPYVTGSVCDCGSLSATRTGLNLPGLSVSPLDLQACPKFTPCPSASHFRTSESHFPSGGSLGARGRT